MAADVNQHELPLVVIAGPTASGKTALAIKLAVQFDGEIICADSRTIYKGMDIGTAKPTPAEQAHVPHWGLDLVEPGERFTVADFKVYADDKVAEIRSRGKIPFLVGGSGLYVDAVVYDYQFPEVDDGENLRSKLADMAVEELHEYCIKNNVVLPENDKNKRYVINAILRNNHTPKRRKTSVSTSIIVGIATEKEVLRQRIQLRGAEIFASGAIEEAKTLAKRYGWDSEAMTGNIYPVIHAYLNNEMTLQEATERFCIKDWQLAKRQLTWLKRNEHITWLELDAAYIYLARELAESSQS